MYAMNGLSTTNFIAVSGSRSRDLACATKAVAAAASLPV